MRVDTTKVGSFTPETPVVTETPPPVAPQNIAPQITAHQRLLAGEDQVERIQAKRRFLPSDATVRGRTGEIAHAPFRGGQDARVSRDGTATEIGTTRRDQVTSTVAVTERNFEFMRRLDRNGDGVVEREELRSGMSRAGVTRIRNESADLTRAERDQLMALHQGTGGPISLTYGTSRIGAGTGQTRWSAVEMGLANSTAGRTATLGTVGQSRPTNLTNNDCGPASGLYMNDRRIRAATGSEPPRTHAEADRLIRAMSAGSGTTAPQMAGMMNDHFRHAGGRYYNHSAHDVDGTNLATTLITGLGADPGGVMVPIISTANEADTSGTRHWIVVTGYDGTNVTYYDPAGPDGARHERTMTLDELRDALPAPNAISPNQVVYGTSIPESAAVGALPVGRRIGELEVRFSNRELNVSSTHGIFGSRADAQREAQRVAAATGEDAVVRREGNGYAVYGISEIRSRFGGLWSDNTLTALDPALTDVYMTDPTTSAVRRAASGPPP